MPKTINTSIEEVLLGALKIHPRNANQGDFGAIQQSVEANGFYGTVVANKRTGHILAGNHRFAVAKSMGFERVPVAWVDVDDEEELRILIADNRTTRLGIDNEVQLAELLSELAATPAGLLGTGFDGDDLDDLIGKLACETKELLGDPDEIPEPPDDPITKPGDLWILGEHRVLCGDSTKAEDVERLMAGTKADLCFTSPPYGQQRDYTAEGKAKVADWDGLMRGVFANLPMADAGQVLVNLGLIHREGEWIPYWESWIEWMREHGWRRFGWYVWDQGFGLPGDWNGRFAPSHEFVWHFNKQSVEPMKFLDKKPENIKTRTKGGSTMRGKDGKTVAFTNPEASSQPTKIPDSIIRINRMPGGHGIDHPAIFPVEFPSFAMRAWPGSIYEPFCGSGTTLIAAEQLGRKCYGMEISPQYCDVIVKRWETLTGQKAVLEARDGETD
jgi:DNA modification methylase